MIRTIAEKWSVPPLNFGNISVELKGNLVSLADDLCLNVVDGLCKDIVKVLKFLLDFLLVLNWLVGALLEKL